MQRTLMLVVVLLSLVTVSSAQTITASITGLVTDPSGAVIPKARVVATNIGTNVNFETVTNDGGVYTFPFLPLGSYSVSVEISGFKKSVLGPFKLEVNQIARVDVKLELGDTTQTVEIKDVAPILQTESTQTGDSLGAEKLTALPLNGRNFVRLTLLIPGAVSPNPEGMNNRFGARPYVNGNREQTNNFMLDGVDINDSIDNRVGYSPNVDALEEVRVLTGNAAAEFGNAGGAAVLLQLKSGTNEFRGNVFWFLRNNILDANGFFRNRNLSTATRTGFRRNIFGGTLGGPIQRNRTFFFMDYEGTRQSADGPATASVAPQAWRNGDLSQFPNVIVDPTNGQPFPNKQIPQSRFSPVARFLFSNPNLYPLPNQPGVGPLGITGNYASASASRLSNHQGDIKIDHRLSDKDNLMGRWSMGAYETLGSRAALPVFMTSGQEGPTQSAVINWNRTISPAIVNEARVAYSRVVIRDNTIDWSGQLGLDGNQKFGIPGGQPIPGLSSITLGSGLSNIGAAATLSNTADNKFIYYDNLTWQKGKHVLKMGAQFMRYQQNRYYAGNNGALGLFRYNGTYTGLDFADFLIDALNSKGRGAATGTWGHRFWRSALFFQDDFKVSTNFTLNLGLRWEYMQPIYEVADRQINVNTFTGQLIRPGSGEFGRALYKGYPWQFMPRIGFAWVPGILNNKFVIRAGYAYQSFMEGTGANLRLPLNPPHFVETDFTYDPRTPGSIRTGFADVVTQNITLDMPRPAGVITPQLQGRAWDLNLRPQTTSQMNFTLEYQLDNATSVSAGYVGQKGTHLVAPVEANQPLPGTGPFATWPNLNLRRPLINVLPNLGNIARTESSATMDYHSLQLTGRRKFSSGFEFIAAYTFGKTLTDNLGYYGSAFASGEGAYWQNAYDRRSNRGPAFFDVRHNFTIGGNYDLPFGRGKRFGSDVPRAVDFLLGGWSLNYNLAARTGLPLTVRANDRTGQAVRGNVRANRYRPLQINKAARNVDNWFGLGPDRATLFCPAGVDDGRCAYGQPADGQFGTSGIGTERGPGFFNTDLAIGKRFSVSEKNYFEFRAEMFNAFNNVSWAPPFLNINSPATFGAITAQVNAPRNIQFGLKYYF
ncbi:MAG: TonB-dependent receptor [Bryobacteraceae bacterium]|nr:TonB-dependent receptor [Bryobacteraceae bacterium]MDW8380170.1 TonB-dependent receptor [Bryobacterales bacterium]